MYFITIVFLGLSVPKRAPLDSAEEERMNTQPDTPDPTDFEKVDKEELCRSWIEFRDQRAPGQRPSLRASNLVGGQVVL